MRNNNNIINYCNIIPAATKHNCKQVCKIKIHFSIYNCQITKLAPCGTDGRLLRNVNTFMLTCLQSVLPVSLEKLPKAETSISVFFSVSKQLLI